MTKEHPSEIKTLEAKLKDAEEKEKENYDKYLRSVAELENFKKRTAKEQEERLRFSHEILLKELLKVLDDFDRVMEHLPQEKSPAIQGLVDGIQFVHQDCFNILSKFGLKEIKIKDKTFDPHFHEAIAHAETNEHKEGDIVKVHRKGYLLHDRLLRPASVTVAKTKQIQPDEK